MAGAVGPLARERLGVLNAGRRARPLGRREPRAGGPAALAADRGPAVRAAAGHLARRWKAASGDPAIETRLVPLVRSLVGTWAAAAERQAAQQQGDVLAASSATRPRHATRGSGWCPTTLAHALAFRFNQPVPAADLDAWWTRQAAADAAA